MADAPVLVAIVTVVVEAVCPYCGYFHARLEGVAVPLPTVRINCRYRGCNAKNVVARLKVIPL